MGEPDRYASAWSELITWRRWYGGLILGWLPVNVRVMIALASPVPKRLQSERWFRSVSSPLALIVAAGLLQKLPGGDAGALADSGGRLLPEVLDRALLGAGGSGPALLRALLPGTEMDVLAKRPLEFRCGCSRERVHRALLALGRAELEDLLASEGQAEATCEFCTTRHVIPADALRTLIDSASPS